MVVVFTLRQEKKCRQCGLLGSLEWGLNSSECCSIGASDFMLIIIRNILCALGNLERFTT